MLRASKYIYLWERLKKFPFFILAKGELAYRLHLLLFTFVVFIYKNKITEFCFYIYISLKYLCKKTFYLQKNLLKLAKPICAPRGLVYSYNATNIG